ncbi:hypothetical protein NMT12_50144 [metagenome]
MTIPDLSNHDYYFFMIFLRVSLITLEKLIDRVVSSIIFACTCLNFF